MALPCLITTKNWKKCCCVFLLFRNSHLKPCFPLTGPPRITCLWQCLIRTLVSAHPHDALKIYAHSFFSRGSGSPENLCKQKNPLGTSWIFVRVCLLRKQHVFCSSQATRRDSDDQGLPDCKFTWETQESTWFCKYLMLHHAASYCIINITCNKLHARYE